MRYILRRFVAGIAGFAGLMTYAALQGLPFAIDVAICVGFTVEVAGLLLTARLLSTRPGRPMRPVPQMILIHLGFLAGVVLIERIYPLMQLLFPGGPVHHGRQGSWALLVSIIVITLLGYAERIILLHGPQPKAGAWADEAIAPMPIAAPAAPRAAAPAAPLVNGVAAPAIAAPGYTSLTGYTFESPAPVAQIAPVAVSQAAPLVNGVPAPAAGPAVYKSITGFIPEAAPAPAPGSPAFSSGTTSYYSNSTGDDYEEFLLHLKSGKRPFRKPGMSVKEEYELWFADRMRKASGAPEKKSGFGRFLQVGRNVN